MKRFGAKIIAAGTPRRLGLDGSMKISVPPLFQKRAHRRRFLFAGAAGLAASAGLASLLANAGKENRSLPSALDFRTIEALGDGFYLVDGWVLTADDVQRLGGAVDARTPGGL